VTISRGNKATVLSASNGGSLTWATNPTAGQKVLVAAFSLTGESISSVADNGVTPTTYTLDYGPETDSAGNQIWFYRADSITLPSSGSYVVTVTGSGGHVINAGGIAYSGVKTGGPTAKNNATGTTGGTVTTGSVTPTWAGALFLQCAVNNNAASETITLGGSGFTQQYNQPNGAAYLPGAIADQIAAGGPASTSGSWTFSGSTVPWVGAIITYDTQPVSVSLTTPNVALAAPLVTPSAGATVALTTPNVALAAPLLAPAAVVAVALTTPNVALAAPAVSLTAGATVALTTPNVALAAPLITPAIPFDVLPATPNPLAPLDARIELDLNGWTDISQYVQRDPVVIGRGHPDESTTTTATTLAMTLCNTDGRFTSTNPAGPYYGYLGRNARCRISFPEGASYLRIEEDQSSYAQCPDSAGVSITGDMDVQLDVTLDNWRANQILAAKWAETGNERTWKLLLREDGELVFAFSANGTGIDATSSTEFGGQGLVPYPPLGRLSVRVTFQSSTGTVQFYTAPPGNLATATWTQLGDTSAFGSASLFDSTAPVQVGWCTDDSAGDPGFTGIFGKVHAFRLLSGIGGTAAASPDFTAQAAGTTSFADAQGNTWTAEGTSEISDRKYRFHGEIAAWPQTQDASGATVYSAVSGGGLLRRTGQAQASLSSAMTRAYLRLPAADQLAAFWPAEDGSLATSIASGIGGPAMEFTGTPGSSLAGTPQLASSTVFQCSSALPVCNGATFTGAVPPNSLTWDANVIRFLWAPPAGGETNGAKICRAYTTGTCAWVELTYGTGGTMAIGGYSGSGVQLFTSAFEAFGLDGGLWRVSLELSQSGGSITWGMVTVAPGADTGLVQTGTLASATVGAVTRVQFSDSGLSQSVMGEFSVQATVDTVFDLGSPLDAWTGETAGNRFSRLCSEEGYQFRGRGQLDDTAAMGPQTQQTVIALLQECVDADLGIMWELRQQLGFGYRTRPSTGNMAAAVTLSYDADHLDIPSSPPLEDDQTTVNDVTVTQTSDGSLARQFAQAGQPIDGGALSISDPPAGIGRYDQQYPVNLDLDTQLPDNAGWRLHMGTVDQPRYPGIAVDLANAALASLWYSLLDLDIGDRLAVTDPPAWLPPGTVDQVINGMQETFAVRGVLEEEFQGIPYAPWPAGYCGGDTEGFYGWVDTDGSQLASGATATATTISVEPTSPYTGLWTTTSSDWPFDIMAGGEQMTVTNVSGASSPQTFTVTRSVNGVSKTQTANTDVRLAYPAIVSM
jgi:hypothetical protein